MVMRFSSFSTWILLALFAATSDAFAQSKDIWISASELAQRPTSGKAWEQVLEAADAADTLVVEGGHGSRHDVHTMAAALVAVRLNDDNRRQIVADNIIKAVTQGVENDGNSLSLTRTVTGYILAADLIDLKNFAPASDSTFRNWLEHVIYELKLDNATQVEKHENRGNNHGTQAGVARIAAAIYLDKTDDLNQAATVFRGWLGDRAAYSGFSWGDLCWQADQNNPVGILPLGSTMLVAGEMRNVDGVQPDDQRRAGCPDTETTWPPRTDVHVWGGLSGAVGQAYLLSRAGFDAWNWEDQAILRSVSWLHDPARGNAPADDDDVWTLPLVDLFYGTTFWNGFPDVPGKQVGWTEWTHGGDKSTLLALDIDLVGLGAVELSPTVGPYVEGTTVTLTAIPDSGWIFTGWHEDLGGLTNPVTILMDDLKEITATFEKASETVTVRPVLSTAPIDHADDPAIWIHPTAPEKSVIIGTDRDDGIFVWDMNGNQLQALPQNTRLYDVDLRRNVQFGSETADIVVASMRDHGKLAVFKVNPNYVGADVLIQIADTTSTNNNVQLNSYGFCLYKRPSDNVLFAFDRPKSGGSLRQYRLDFDSATHQVFVTPVRDLNYDGGRAKGFVADDALGFLYVAEKNDGIHKFYADPSLSSDPIGFFATDDGIVPSREGLALYTCSDNTGYLILSSHGNSTLKVYDREGGNELVKTIIPLDSNGIGGIATEGLDVTSLATSSAFPNGLLVAQDDNSNRFHFYDWADVAETDLNVCANGSAISRPDIVVEPSSYDFGTLEIKSTATQSFTVFNLGEGNLSVSLASLVENEDDQLTLAGDSSPFILLPGETHVLTVQFDAASVGGSSAKLRLISNDPDERVLDIAITGQVKKTKTSPGQKRKPDIAVLPSSVDFGQTALGETSSAVIKIVNEGQSDLDVTDLSLVGGQTSAFSLSDQTAFVLASGDTHQISVAFHPTVEGTAATTLRFTSNDPDENPFDANLTGVGVDPLPQVAVDPTSHAYGEVAVGDSLSQAFEIRNNGLSLLEVLSISLVGDHNNNFEIENNSLSFSLDPGAIQAVNVNFRPTTEEAELQTTLRIESNDPANSVLDIPLTGSSLLSTSVIFSPSDDAYVLSTDETGNFGTSETIRILNLTSSELYSFLKFNISGLTGPVRQALLRLTTTDGSDDGGAVYSVSNDYSSTSAPWVESGLRWTNAPQITGSLLASAGTVITNEVVEFDVTTAIVGNGIYSFGIKGGSTDLTMYSSKEGTASPQLVIKVLPLNIPVISAFIPTTGVTGTEVTVSGVNFSGVTEVTFNGTTASGFSVDSDNQLRAIAPPGATSGKLSLTNSDGIGSSTQDFVVIQIPVITSFSPAGGPTGTLVTISGGQFIEVNGVFFNGLASTSFSVGSVNQLTAIVPNGANSGPVRITNPAGTVESADSFAVKIIPSVLSFVPTSGAAGAEVTVTGINLSEATDVSFDGTSAATFTVDADSVLRAMIPTGATTGKISVTNGDGTGSSAEDFLVIQAPKITALFPSTGPAGTLVTLSGNHFQEVTSVSFNGISAGLTVISDNELETMVPSGASTGSITVVNSAGTDTTTELFTVTAPPSSLTFPPIHDSFVRAARPANNYGGADELRVRNPSSGHDDTFLKFDVRGLSGQVVSAKVRLHVINASPDGGAIYPVSNNYEGTTIPWTEGGLIRDNAPSIAGTPLSSHGAVNIGEIVEFNVTTAITEDGIYSFAISNSDRDAAKYSSKEGVVIPKLIIEQLTSNVPGISSFAPDSGPSSVEVTISGTNFTGTFEVNFNGVSATTFIVDSNSQIRATVPGGATTGKVGVINADGTALSTQDFTVIHVPEIASFSPASGPVGTTVTVSGIHFVEVIAVLFNGTNATSFTLNSVNEFTAVVPDGASTGPISVMNSAGTGVSADSFAVKYIPSVASFEPASGAAGTEVTVTGGNFIAVGEVTFNGALADSFVVEADSLLRAVVPPGATTGKLSITNPDGTGSSSQVFVVLHTPEITSLAPLSGPVGSTVTVSGDHFSDITGVFFNGVRASSFAVASSNELTAVAPNNATTGPISVVNAIGAAVSVDSFAVTFIPSVTAITPLVGAAGTEVTVLGVNLSGVTDVAFNGTSAESFSVHSDSSLMAVVPIGATTGKVSVTNADGTGLSTQDFVIVQVPEISSFTPESGPVGSTVTVFGNHFVEVSSVLFAGVLADNFTIGSPTQLEAVVPADASTGPISVANFTGTAVSADSFAVTFIPVIDSFSPATGVTGTEATVAGINFSAVTSVAFNGMPAASFTVDSDSLLRAVVSAGTSTGKVSVTNGDGTGVSTEDFVMIQAAEITTFSPVSGPVGILVTVFGSNFVGVTEVNFNGIAGSFNVVSTGQLEIVVPSGATTGNITMINVAGTATSPDVFTVTEPPRNLTFIPIHDSFARSSRPTNNYGGDDELRVRNPSAGPVNTYLKFDVQGLSGTIVNAKLRLHVIDASSDGGAIYPVSNDYEGTPDPWTEDGLRWDNAPVIGGAPLSSHDAVNLGETVEFDVTAAILGDGFYSFGVINNSSDVAKYSSKEGAVSPELVIEQLASLTPRIVSFVPASGPAGTEVTVTGVNFTGAVNISFNAISASNFTIASDNQATVNVPAGATTGQITVTNSDGTGFSTEDFVVLLPPQISSFTPGNGPLGATVTVMGNNFVGVTDVSFNGVFASNFVMISPTELQAIVPDAASTGPISVMNSAGTGVSASVFAVTFVPNIAFFTPIKGTASTEVTVTGSNFAGVTEVSFNGVATQNFSVDSDSLLRATVPAGASSGKLGVTNGDGMGLSNGDFVVIQMPQIITFAPLSGPVGTPVLVTGEDLDDISSVSFNGIPASFVSLSSNQIEAIVSEGATTGKISITNVAGTALSSSDFTLTDPPSEFTFNPIHDSFARSSRPTNNYANDDELRVRNSSGGPVNAYLKFQVQGLPGSVVRAKILLHVIDASSDGGGIYTVSNNYEGTAVPWKEGGLTWENAPVISGDPLSATDVVNLGETVEFDVTLAITGDGIFSFGVRNNSSDAAKYSSKEGVQSPQLIVEVTGSTAKVFRESEASTGSQSAENQQAEAKPAKVTLGPNYPNPFNLETTFEYYLPVGGKTTIRIFNLRGQLVRILADAYQKAGVKTVRWDGRDGKGQEVASGVFFIRLQAGNTKFSRKITLQK